MVGFLAGMLQGPPPSADFEATDVFVITELEIVPRRPLTFRPQPVEVHSWVTHLGTTSWSTRHRILDPGPDPGEYATATSRTVAIDRVSTRPRPLRDYEREFLTGFLEIAEAVAG